MSLSNLAPRTNDDDDNNDDDGILSEINITPLTDIFLVLLIIFMVTSTVMSQLGVDVNLPQANEQLAKVSTNGVSVTLLPNGQISVAGEIISTGDWDAFTHTLRKRLKEKKQNLVILRGDRTADLGAAVDLMDYARQAGAKKFAIATKRK